MSKIKPRQKGDSEAYRQKKRRFEDVLTVYGRKPVLEAVMHPEVQVLRLHLADSNKPAAILDQITHAAEEKGAELCYHDRKSLSYISKNGKQDQGVAVDLKTPGLTSLNMFIDALDEQEEGRPPPSIIALDGLTNPQNVGMIIRSVCAAPNTALLIPNNSGAKLDSLAIKASAGTFFKAKIIRCEHLVGACEKLKTRGYRVIGLSANAPMPISEHEQQMKSIFALGNETHGLSPSLTACCDAFLSIPMANGVESLNVAITASLLAFRPYL